MHNPNSIQFWQFLNQTDTVPNLGFQHVKYFYDVGATDRTGIYNLIRLQDLKSNKVFMRTAARSFHKDSLPKSFAVKQFVYSGTDRWVNRNKKGIYFKGKVAAEHSGLRYHGKTCQVYPLQVPEDNFFYKFTPSILYVKASRTKMILDGRKSIFTGSMIAPSFTHADKLLKGSKDLIFITFCNNEILYIMLSYKGAAGDQQLLITVNTETGKQEILKCRFIESIIQEKNERFKSFESVLSTDNFEMQIIHRDLDQSVRFYSRYFWLGYATGRIKFNDKSSSSCIVSVIAN